MSLIKSYRVHCEGRNLARRLDTPFVWSGHITNAPVAFDTAAKARREAIKAGWSRVRVNLPILPSHPDAGSTLIAFDLCPGCAKNLKDYVQ